MNLTQEQKRLKLAEACGWKRIPKDDVGAAARLFYGDTWWRDAENNTIASVEQLPDYFNDLNACHNALAILTDKQCYTFNSALSDLKPPRRDIKHPFEKWTWGSPADQYAEALGQTLNLW